MVRRKKRNNWQAFIMANLSLIFLLVFAYIPMLGITIAFKNLDLSINLMKDLFYKPFIGFKKFQEFFSDRQFRTIIENTLGLNSVSLLICFPAPIILALLMNELQFSWTRKTIQTVICLPHFVSWAVFGGLVLMIISADGGVLNKALVWMGSLEEPINFATRPQYFWTINILANLFKEVGWSSIIYLAAIAGVDQSIYESAELDGANRFHMAIHITLPSIIGTAMVMLLLSLGHIMNNSFEQFYVLQNPLNLSRSEVLTTFSYKVGIAQRKYSYTTAVGVFSALVNLIFLGGGNIISKKTSGHGLF